MPTLTTTLLLLRLPIPPTAEFFFFDCFAGAASASGAASAGAASAGAASAGAASARGSLRRGGLRRGCLSLPGQPPRQQRQPPPRGRGLSLPGRPRPCLPQVRSSLSIHAGTPFRAALGSVHNPWYTWDYNGYIVILLYTVMLHMMPIHVFKKKFVTIIKRAAECT